jgi:hypothetical protein
LPNTVFVYFTTAVKILIEIPMEPYLLCLTRCGIRSREYLMLKNGVVVRDPEGAELVQILCEQERARLIRETVARFCPEALGRIRQTIDNPEN